MVKAGVTDHHSIHIKLPFFSQKLTKKNIKFNFRDCSDENQTIFKHKLQNFNWYSINSDDVNICTGNFIDVINKIYCDSFPIKTKQVTEKYFHNPWYTPEVRKLSQARSSYFALYNENIISHADYSFFRNKVTSLIRKCKQTYFHHCFERNIGNIKATWKIIRNLCNNNADRNIKEILHNGITYENSLEIAEIFNTHFVSVAEELANNLPSKQPKHSI